MVRERSSGRRGEVASGRDLEQLAKDVRAHIAALGGLPKESVRDSQLFKEELGFGDYMKAALARGLQKIAREYDPHAKISVRECKRLKKVGDAVFLVKKAAGIK